MCDGSGMPYFACCIGLCRGLLLLLLHLVVAAGLLGPKSVVLPVRHTNQRPPQLPQQLHWLTEIPQPVAPSQPCLQYTLERYGVLPVQHEPAAPTAVQADRKHMVTCCVDMTFMCHVLC